MLAKTPYQPSPRCPHCDNSMRLVRSVGNACGSPEVQTFECDLCGLAVTKMAATEILDKIAV